MTNLLALISSPNQRFFLWPVLKKLGCSCYQALKPELPRRQQRLLHIYHITTQICKSGTSGTDDIVIVMNMRQLVLQLFVLIPGVYFCY